ncbi:MAG: bifunctional oligoribonuclease/PAP phosphatase NrnA [Chloroflexota bacterium]
MSVPTNQFDPITAGAELRAAINASSHVTALCHENPDADTIGGAVAMALIARSLGKQAEVVSTDAPGPMYDYMSEMRSVVASPSGPPDLAVVCDAATLERVGSIALERAAWFADARIVNIDHHVTNTRFGSINVVDPTAAATCQVIADLVPHLGVTLDPALATALMTGIVRDSHGFSDRSTSPRTLRLAADLAAAGADLPFIHRRILGELPYRTMQLWGRLLNSVAASADGRIVYSVLLPEMLAETGTEQHDADGFAEFLAGTQGAQITILLRELKPDETRVSLRVTDEVDATQIAGAFGGGGHRQRAGCTIRLCGADAAAQLLDVCESVLGATEAAVPSR